MNQDPSPGRLAIVVDDFAPNARHVADALRVRRGFDARALTSGFAAIRLCNSATPVIALLDIRMPDLDGVTLAVRLRSVVPKLPVVFVTGSPQDLEHPSHPAIGPPVRVLAKPCGLQAILAAVDEVMREADASRRG